MILGLSGKALSGKDTVADYLIRSNKWDRKTAFAANLKAACKEIFNLSEHQVETQDGKSTVFKRPIVVDHNCLLNIIHWMRKTHDVALQYRPHLHLYDKILETPRDVLQFVGTEVMRHYCNTYHSEVVFNSIDITENVIITDVRFPNEAQDILSNNGILVRINRPVSLRALHGAVIDSKHISETSLDSWKKWSYILDNDSDGLDSLFCKVDTMISNLIGGKQ